MTVTTHKTLVQVAREARWLRREYPWMNLTRRQAAYIALYQVYSMLERRKYRTVYR